MNEWNVKNEQNKKCYLKKDNDGLYVDGNTLTNNSYQLST